MSCRRPAAECSQANEDVLENDQLCERRGQRGHGEALSPPSPLEEERCVRCSSWKGRRCPSAGRAQLPRVLVAQQPASSPQPLPSHLLGVGEGLFVPRFSWEKWEVEGGSVAVTAPVKSWREARYPKWPRDFGRLQRLLGAEGHSSSAEGQSPLGLAQHHASAGICSLPAAKNPSRALARSWAAALGSPTCPGARVAQDEPCFPSQLPLCRRRGARSSAERGEEHPVGTQRSPAEPCSSGTLLGPPAASRGFPSAPLPAEIPPAPPAPGTGRLLRAECGLLICLVVKGKKLRSVPLASAHVQTPSQ